MVQNLHLHGHRMVGHKKSSLKLDVGVADNGIFFGSITIGRFIAAKTYPVYGCLRPDGKFHKIIFAHASLKGNHPASVFYMLKHSHTGMDGLYGISPRGSMVNFHPHQFMNERTFKTLVRCVDEITPQNNLGEVELDIKKFHDE